MKRLFQIMCMLLFCSLCSCSKDSVDENSQNNNAWSLASCQVNGKYWNECGINTVTLKKQSFTEVYTHYDGYYLANTLTLRFYNHCWDQNTDSVSVIGMDVYHFTGEGDYILSTNDRGVYDRRVANFDYFNLYDYQTNDSNTGKLTITKYDTLAKTISGKFYFDAYTTGINAYYTPEVLSRLGYKASIKYGVFTNVPYEIL